MRLAIMQPYYFPYLGYFQLMAAVDAFVILDDVQFIKHGWIHKNQILLDGKAKPIHMTIDHMSQHRTIRAHERRIDVQNERYQLRLLEHAYKKAPSYADVMPLVSRLIRDDERNVAVYLGKQLTEVRNFLGLDTPLLYASSLENDKSKRCGDLVLDLCHHLGADHYINAIGGRDLYNKERFASEGVQLDFIEMQPVTYRQAGHPFVPNLSIIDVLMYNARRDVRQLLDAYTLV